MERATGGTLTVAVLDQPRILEPDGEFAHLVLAVRARIELADRASLLYRYDNSISHEFFPLRNARDCTPRRG